MRINVYAEELGNEVEIVAENRNPDDKFVGVRFNLGAGGSLSKGGKITSDNAVTLWGRAGDAKLADTLERAAKQLREFGSGDRQSSNAQQRQPAHA